MMSNTSDRGSAALVVGLVCCAGNWGSLTVCRNVTAPARELSLYVLLDMSMLKLMVVVGSLTVWVMRGLRDSVAFRNSWVIPAVLLNIRIAARSGRPTPLLLEPRGLMLLPLSPPAPSLEDSGAMPPPPIMPPVPVTFAPVQPYQQTPPPTVRIKYSMPNSPPPLPTTMW